MLFGYRAPGTFGLKVVDAVVDGNTAVVIVAVYHVDERGFLGLRSFRADQWTVNVEQFDGQWKLLNRLP